jgi:hypothetical protein
MNRKSGLAATAASAVLLLASVALAQDGDKPNGEKPQGEAPVAAAESKILVWEKDYDVAKAKAAKEKKGLFVYLTPDWFT